VIVPYAPGGPTDISGRVIAQKLSEQLGKNFFVENVPGVGGNTGTGRAAQAPADGYTLLYAGSPYVINATLYDKVPYDPDKDFEPVGLTVTAPSLLTVHPSVPAKTVKELDEVVNANPGKYSYASPGIGTPPHLLGELFRLSLKLDVVHVPFNSGGLAIGSTVAGHTPISFGASAPAVPHVTEGKLRALGFTGKTRFATLPDVPTMAEAGYPAITGQTWFGILAPAGTPAPVVNALHAEFVKALRHPDVSARLKAWGANIVANSPKEFADVIAADEVRLGKIVKSAGARVD
jgi:tripartite-type tricarboxylate transporter receptor subunit TctC